jgi:hypothetical protein
MAQQLVRLLFFGLAAGIIAALIAEFRGTSRRSADDADEGADEDDLTLPDHGGNLQG